MPKVTYMRFQKKYEGLLVALSKADDKVLCAAATGEELKEKIAKKNLKPGEYVLFGPVPKIGTYQIV